MAAIKKEVLEAIEAEHGLTPGDLTYPQRCSRAAAYQQGRGALWSVEDTDGWKRSQAEIEKKQRDIKNSPLYKKKILITPKMVPDKDRALYVDEELGYDMEVDEMDAGTAIQGAGEGVDRMFQDYQIRRVSKDHKVVAKTWVPKIGTEISYTLGEDIVPVVEGTDGQRGYIWSYVDGETHFVQVYGLKTLISSIYPELLDEFQGPKIIKYIDGVTLAAGIPQTKAILKQHRRKQLQDKKLGLS